MRPATPRQLIICADDFGIGPETSRGVLELAARRAISATVLIVNSPYAEDAVRNWRRAQPACDLGWHPNLTLDRPILPAKTIRSLVDDDGLFHPLATFCRYAWLGRLRADEVAAELGAQLDRFRELTGTSPAVVNAHQHIAIFTPVGAALSTLLESLKPLPYLRRLRETWRSVFHVSGARLKRLFLGRMARCSNRLFDSAGFPGCDFLAGVANHADVHRSNFFAHWLRRSSGQVVELMVHPGRRDETLIGRDCTPTDGCLARRVHELGELSRPEFAEAVAQLGFEVVRPSELQSRMTNGRCRAA